ncbi:amidohydrolase family protein [Herbiconiux moechotypicola]|uniref:Amidohydrolase family protein n=1 Tax=Herbiconiux moechotypicola TaxID=637393 RepID=A0ABN3D9L1_9MICO|nr:amidohydrolase family protein [Herbiconiux moechotypicola]MCS5728170.1 amidohydrolase family protein [Herbiconiux moechotypicola]
MTAGSTGVTTTVGARVMDAHGRFAPRTLRVEGDRIASVSDAAADATGAVQRAGGDSVAGERVVDARGLWVMPGVVDVHDHVSWNDFHHDERDARSDDERQARLRAGLAATLRAGVTTVRDAGGADAGLRDRITEGDLPGPRLRVAVDMIGGAQIASDTAGSVDRMRAAVAAALAKGADWVKLVATSGVASPGESVLEPLLTRDEIAAAVEEAAEAGVRVMVHTWGGDSLDWAVDEGAASIEHGIHLTSRQAARAAAAGTVFVPTLTIYRRVLDLVRSGALAGVPEQRVADAVSRHVEAVRHALDAGLPLALGSDFSTPEQHGTNLAEIAALVRAGVPAPDALVAATRTGAELLRIDAGVLEPGRLADLVLLRSDPLDPVTFDDAGAAVAVMQGGEWVHDDVE